MNSGSRWFENWFDSPYYHKLYQHRDEKEAAFFIDNLFTLLKPPPQSRVLDLACGKGRHAVHMAKQDVLVVGLDLSPESILYARQFEKDNLSFYQHDMRLLFRINYFDFIFNLFTSFGYFEKDRDHEKTLKNVYQGLKSGGHFILDFMNSPLIISQLVSEEEKTAGDIHFKITRNYEEGYLVKRIYISDGDQHFEYQERVRAFTKDELTDKLTQVGFTVRHVFGDYALSPFQEESSRRLIFIVQKNA